MSRYSYVVGIVPPDEKFLQMKAVYNACKEAGVPVPNDVDVFFNGEKPDDSGVKISLRGHPSVSEYRADSEDGLEIVISDLPPNVKIVRFVNSY